MRTTPLQYQQKYLTTHLDKPALFWDMGLGKTWMGCYFLEQTYRQIPHMKTLVVCPNSVRDVWYDETLKHTEIDKKNISVITGTREKRIKELFKLKPISIISYDALRGLSPFIKSFVYDVMILDESHNIKTPNIPTTKAILSLIAKKRYILTGTPIAKNYRDIFTQFLFLDHGETFGTNYYVFLRKYFIDTNIGRFKGNFPIWEVRPEKLKALKNKIAAKAHRLEKAGNLSLPPKIYSTRYCSLSGPQEQFYRSMKRDCIATLNDVTITAQIALTKVLRLAQITSGFLIDPETKKTLDFTPNNKLKLLEETVEEIMSYNKTNKIVIWARFIHNCESIYKLLHKYNPVLVYGATPNKTEMIRKFQEDDTCRILVGNPATISTGVTLTKSNYVIRYSYDYYYREWVQSENRTHRKGSEIHTSIQYITLVVRNSIDDVILNCITENHTTALSILDYIKKNNAL